MLLSTTFRDFVDLKNTSVFVSNVVSAQVCRMDKGGDCEEMKLSNSTIIRFNLTVSSATYNGGSVSSIEVHRSVLLC